VVVAIVTVSSCHDNTNLNSLEDINKNTTDITDGKKNGLEAL